MTSVTPDSTSVPSERMPITASAPATSAWTNIVSNACWRVRSASSVKSEIFPPNNVWMMDSMAHVSLWVNLTPVGSLCLNL